MHPLLRACLLFLALLLPFLAMAALNDQPENNLELTNGVIRLKANVDYGGSITYLSSAKEDRNIINNHDRGRQVQQSYYAGKPLDRRNEGQSAGWSPWPWNPIGAGDCYGNKPAILDSSNDGKTIYVKAQPLLWDMKNEKAECFIETWITLEGSTAHVRNKLTCFRTDNRWETAPCSQEIPAVYSIGDLYHLYTYEGAEPFTHAPLKEIENSGPPWASWGKKTTQEKWAALVDDHQWGIGVYTPKTECFTGGFHGEHHGGVMDDATGYIAPLAIETLDKNSTYEYDYYLILGTLEEIRAFVYKAEGKG